MKPMIVRPGELSVEHCACINSKVHVTLQPSEYLQPRQSCAFYELRAAELHQQHTRLLIRVLYSCFAPMSRSAPPLAPSLMFMAPDGTHHPLIDLCSDSSENEAAAGGLHEAIVEVGDALDPSHWLSTPARMTSVRGSQWSQVCVIVC